MKDGFYWVRYIDPIPHGITFGPEVARWEEATGTWHCTGDEVAYDPEDFEVLSAPLHYEARHT